MVKNVSVNQLLFSDLLVKEPVDRVNEQITGDDKRGKFILTGSRGCGKSVVLGSRESQSIKSENPAVLTRFDGAGLFGTKDNKYFNKQIIEHYYEIVMCKKFLDYVKEYYPDLYFSKFTRLDHVTANRLCELDNYINNAMYKDVGIGQKLFSGEALSEMLSLFRVGTGCDSLTLMIDRFDWTHNSDPRVQEILKNYFTMFEKVIITSDDPMLATDKKKVAALEDKGFKIVGMDYSKDLDTVIDIVERRFDLDEDERHPFPIEDVSEEDFRRLIDKSGGNLDTVLEAFQYAETLKKWDSRKSISAIVDEAGCEKVNAVKQLRKMTKPPKLHI